MPTVLVSGVCERDIDLLLLAEFVANPSLVGWFIEKVRFYEAHGFELLQAQRSATQTNGESDLELLLSKSDSRDRYMLMLENKISASFTPRQSERYVERGRGYVSHGRVAGFRTVLVAPQTYLGSSEANKGFDAVVSYEAVMEQLSAKYTNSPRLSYITRMIEAAVEKSSVGWQLREDQSVTTSWHRYWELSNHVAPELELPEPTGKPAGSGFVYFKPPQLPKRVKLVHKWPHGNVDLQFSGLGNQTYQLRTHFSQWLASDMEIAKAAKSAVVRLRVPKFDVHTTLPNADELMLSGISAAQRLLAWYEELPEDVRSGAPQPNKAMQQPGDNADH